MGGYSLKSWGRWRQLPDRCLKSFMSNKTGNVRITNIDARSRNHCCRGKAISITYWSVCACLHIRALLIQHATRMRHIVTPLSQPIFRHYLINGAIFGKKVVEYKTCFDFLYNFFCLKHLPFYEEFIAILSKMSKRLHVMYPLLLSDFNEIWIFLTDYRKKKS